MFNSSAEYTISTYILVKITQLTTCMTKQYVAWMCICTYCMYVSVLGTGWICTHNCRVFPLLPQATVRQCRSTPSRTQWRPCGWVCRISWPTGPSGWLEHTKSTSSTGTPKSCWIGCRWAMCVVRGKNGWGFGSRGDEQLTSNGRLCGEIVAACLEYAWICLEIVALGWQLMFHVHVFWSVSLYSPWSKSPFVREIVAL